VVAERILRSDFTFSVVEGCSGLRSVVTLSMLSVLMVDLFRRHGLHAAILVLTAPLIAFGLNAVRALVLARLAVTARAEPAPPPPLGFASLRASLAGERRRAPARLATTLLLLALLAGLSVGIRPWITYEPVPLALPYRFERQIGEWTASRLETDRLFLGSVAFRESLSLRYQQGGEAVDLFLGIGDRAQRFSSPLSPKTERPGSGWTIEERGSANLDSRDGGGDIDALVERSATRQLLVYHWVDGSARASSEALRSLLALDATPWPQLRDPLVVRLSTEIGGPGAGERRLAEERLQRFWASLRGDLEKLIRDMEHFSSHTRRKGFS
jgi:EpsI family protein